MAAIRWLLMMALLVGALPLAQADKPSHAREEWMSGFLKLEEGGKAEEGGRASVALDLYRQALATFREVQRKYPAWNPSLMTYRITFCEKRIERLEGVVGEKAATMPKADLEVVVRNQVAKIRELADETRTLKADLAEARDSLERARREAARVVNRDTDVRALVKERKDLQDKLQAAKAENQRLNEELRDLQSKGGLKALADRLKVELDQARARQAELEEARETYKKAWANVKKRLQDALDTREKDIAFVAKLQARMATAEKQAQASADALAKAQQEWEALKTAKEQAEAEAKAQAEEAAAALARLAPLREENAQLRSFRDQALQKTSQAAQLEKQVRELADAKAAAVAQAEGLRADVEKSLLAAAKLEKELAELRLAATTSETEAKNTVAALQGRLAEAEATSGKQAQRLAALDQELARARQEKEQEARAHQEARTAWEADRKRLLAAAVSTSAAGKELEQLRAERNQLADKVKQLSATVATAADVPGLTRELAAQKEQTQQLATSLAKAKSDLARAAEEKLRIEAALAESKRKAETLAPDQNEIEAARQAKELLEAQLADARRKLKAAADVNANQERLLAASEKRAEDLAALGKQLKEREQRLAEAQESLGDLRKRLSLAEKEAAKSDEQSRSSRFEVVRLRTRLDAAEKRVQEMDEQIASYQRTRKTADDTRGAQERLREAATMVKDLQQESDRLKSKTEEQLQLLRNQEQAIAKLEKDKADLARQIEARNRQVEQLQGDKKMLISKSEVSDGLANSLADLDGKLAASRRDLARLQRERDQAQGQAREFKERLDTARRELSKTRDLLDGKTTPTATGELYREQVRRLTVQLEKESQRRRTLEELLSKLQAEDGQAAPEPVASTSDEPRPLPPAADRVAVYDGATFPEAAERERREKQRQLVVRGYLRQAVTAEEAGNVETARWNYGKVLENDSDNYLATQRLGLIAAELGEDREAISFLKRAFRLNPDDQDTLLPLGFALVRQSEPDLAISMLSRAVALKPDDPNAHRCLGIACSTLGWLDVAEVQFRRTYKLNPKDAENAFNMAVLLATREPPRLEEAKTWYLRARKLGAASDPGLDRVFGLKEGEGE
jgi:chromosome segregation ATPase